MDENQRFEEIINKGLEEFFKRNPRVAVQFGIEEYEKVIESGTAEHIMDNLKWFSQWVDELRQLNVERLNFENQISLKAMEYYHNINLFMHKEYPLWKKQPNGLACFQETIFLLFQRKGPTTGMAEAIIAHLSALPKYLEEFQSRFDDTSIPIVWRDLALNQVQTIPEFLQNISQAFNKSLEVIESLKSQLQKAFEEVESIVQKHMKWIKSLSVDDDEFAWALGPEKFDKLLSLRKLPWDRNELMREGSKQFNSAFKKLKQIAKEINPNKSLNEVIEDFFKEDQVPTFQEVLEYTRSETERAKEFIKSHNFATFPKEKLTVIETPPHLRPIMAAAALYGAPYFGENQPGIYLINPTIKEPRCYTQLSIFMVHEAYPGHHLDFVCNNEFAPLIRLLGTALETAEGWAHYCEEMMLQQGFYKDPIKTQQFMSGMQVMRAMEIILDIQLHCKQRSIEDAINLLMNTLQVEETAAKAQILGYTSNPGYPLSYLVGKLLINNLQEEMEEKMGSKFSLKFFHDTILRSGDLPYYLLKEYFGEIIKNI